MFVFVDINVVFTALYIINVLAHWWLPFKPWIVEKMVNNKHWQNYTAVGSCTVRSPKISPTVTNLTREEGKWSCQVQTCISLFLYFNLFHICCHALSSSVIIYAHPFHTCLVRLNTYVCKNMYFWKQVWCRSASISTSKGGSMMCILKYWRPPQHTADLCWLLSQYILYFGPLSAQHVGGGENTVKTNAWSVEFNLQLLPVGVGLAAFYWCLPAHRIQKRRERWFTLTHLQSCGILGPSKKNTWMVYNWKETH